MGEAKHTPGPWLYIRLDEWSHSVATQHGELPDGSPNLWTVATVNKNREPEHEANARLIAAAPDLLGALQAMLRMWDEGGSLPGLVEGVITEANAAIAKANGAES